MNLRNFFLLSFVVGLLFALGLLLGASTVLGLFKIKAGPAESVVAQLLGAALIVPALISWFARDVSEPASRTAVVFPLFLFNAIGFVVSLLAVLSKAVSVNGWIVVALFLLFALGFGYFQFFRTAD